MNAKIIPEAVKVAVRAPSAQFPSQLMETAQWMGLLYIQFAGLLGHFSTGSPLWRQMENGEPVELKFE